MTYFIEIKSAGEMFLSGSPSHGDSPGEVQHEGQVDPLACQAGDLGHRRRPKLCYSIQKVDMNGLEDAIDVLLELVY